MSKKMTRNETKFSKERLLEVIRRPLITEKATLASQYNQYGFVVATDATKPEVKKAVEELFKVKVTAVNTILSKGKEKRFKGRIGKRSDMKKAFVTLEAGQTIDLSVGI